MCARDYVKRGDTHTHTHTLQGSLALGACGAAVADEREKEKKSKEGSGVTFSLQGSLTHAHTHMEKQRCSIFFHLPRRPFQLEQTATASNILPSKYAAVKDKNIINSKKNNKINL